jgi:hypothetical protein
VKRRAREMTNNLLASIESRQKKTIIRKRRKRNANKVDAKSNQLYFVAANEWQMMRKAL